MENAMERAELLAREKQVLEIEMEALRVENNSLKGRLARYRAQANHAMEEAHAFDRGERVRGRVLDRLKMAAWVVWMAVGIAVFCAALGKLGAWIAYIAR